MLSRFFQRPTSPLDFPQGLRDMLVGYLHMNPEISLRLTCRSYTNCIPAMTTSMDRVIDSPDLTFERICMNERDPTFRPTKRLVCSGCKRLHGKLAFPKEELLKKGKERNCVGRLGHFYFFPEGSFSFQGLLDLTGEALSVNSIWMAGDRLPKIRKVEYIAQSPR